MRRRFSKDDILMEDADLLVVRKYAGMAVQSARPGQMDLEHELRNYLAEGQTGDQRRIPYLAVIHRLDQPVQGILVFGKNLQAAAALNRELQSGGMEKDYLAVVEGKPSLPEGVLVDYLIKDGKRNLSQAVEKGTPGAKRAELSYRLVETVRKEDSQKEYSLLEIRLKTGRHHQIRVQMAHAGMPLCGDSKYHLQKEAGVEAEPQGQEKRNVSKAASGQGEVLALCAYRLAFHHPRTGKLLRFWTAPEGEVFSGFNFQMHAGKVRKKS